MPPETTTRPPRPVAGFVVGVVLLALAVAAVPLLRSSRVRLQQESDSLRRAERAAVGILDSLRRVQEQVSAMLTLERARAGAREERALHLVVAVDSGTVALMRDGITLRQMPASFRGGIPSRGALSIARIASVPVRSAPTVDSLGAVVPGDTATVAEQVTLSDGTVLAGGDAASALLGGVEVAPGPRMILVSRRDFAALRPNLVRGMKAVLF